MRSVYFNGEFVPESEAKISIYDSALMFGDMVFEMTRSFNKEQFKLKEHIDRLFMSMKYLSIDCGMTPEEMMNACLKTIEINEPYFEKDDEHRLMIDVTRGPLSTYLGVQGLQNKPNIIIADFPLRWTVRGIGKLYDSGVNAVIPSQRTIDASLLEPKVKNRSRIHYQMANIQVSQMKGDNNWALLLDSDGFVTEGTGANFFIVKNNTLYTPEPRNVLRGISRDFVIHMINSFEFCNTVPKFNLKVYEKNIEPYDVYMADEAFFTATPFCILPVTSINGVKIGDGSVGYATKLLLKMWSDFVGVDIVTQIKEWNNKELENTGISPYIFKK